MRYTLQQIEDAFKKTVEKEICEEFKDMAWDLFMEFNDELVKDDGKIK